MTASAIAQAATLLRQRTASAETDYEALINKLAAGGDEQPEAIVAVAEAAGRTLDELQSDIGKLEGLAAARAQVAELPALLQRITAAEQKRADLSAELAAAQKRIGAQQELLSAELQAALAAKARLEEVQRQIGVGKFDLPAQAAKRAAAAKVVSQNGMTASNLQYELNRERNKLAGMKARPIDGDDNDRKQAIYAMAAAERRIAAIERELRPVEQAMSAANAVFAELAGGAA